MSFKTKQEWMMSHPKQNMKIDMREYSNNDILHQHKRRIRVFDGAVWWENGSFCCYKEPSKGRIPALMSALQKADFIVLFP